MYSGAMSFLRLICTFWHRLLIISEVKNISKHYIHRRQRLVFLTMIYHDFVDCFPLHEVAFPQMSLGSDPSVENRFPVWLILCFVGVLSTKLWKTWVFLGYSTSYEKERFMHDEVWQAVLGEIELSISRGSFVTWFKRTRLLKCTDEQVVIGVGTIFIKQQMEKRYND
ncbi:hypothetical protein KC957_00540, partial [Candidatus Saccharibacteria bacterium]|nr:hypothetical protein [Candidatus Saccharibacteria bacterium]